MRIGIPRALFYFCYPGLWEDFFPRLGIEVLVSRPTSLRTIERAGLVSESEHCLPMKLLDAHVDELVGRVEAILVPRLLSMRAGHVSCTKLGALPDAVHARNRGRTRVLTVDIDANREPLARSLTNLACQLGIPRRTAGKAAAAALSRPGQPPGEDVRDPDGAAPAPILLTGHPYIVHEEFIVHPIVRRLEELGLPVRRLDASAGHIVKSFMGWDTCSKLYSALVSLQPGEVSGVVQISSFNCGCDSMTIEFYRDLLRTKRVPYLVLMIDEHTAPTGLETRLEAFVDSMGW